MPQRAQPRATMAAVHNDAGVAFVKTWIERLAGGNLDRSQLTPYFNAYLTDSVVAAAQRSLTALGKPESIVPLAQGLRGGMHFEEYAVTFSSRTSTVLVYRTKDGKIAEFLFA
jgi:hypothetical protein